MPRYINEDEFVAWAKKCYCSDCNNDNGLMCRVCWIDDAIDLVEEAPEADVAPRSEVEEWYHEYHRIKDELKQEREYHRSTEKLADRYMVGLQTAKTEVAREIFDDIANMMVLQHGFNEKHIVAHIDFELLKELKKKYTEGDANA